MYKEEKTTASIHSVDVEEGITSYVTSSGRPTDTKGSGDEAIDYALSESSEALVPDPKEERKLLFKIDCFLLPLICLLYAVQFMDKLTTSYASVMGLRQDLHMTGNQYSWTGSAFYLGYLVFEFPCAYALQRFPVINTVSVFIILWGMIMCLHAVPQYAGFVTLRTILGALESSVTPAFVIVTAQWYKKDEVFLRTALWYSFNGVGMMLGSGAIAYNLHKHMDRYPIEAWKLIFIITGSITIFLGILIFFHIPNKPTQAWFLNDREKRLVVERIRINQQGFGNKHFKKYQFIEAMLDIKTWLYFLIGISSCIPNGGITNFSSILLNESFGYDVGQSFIMQIYGGIIELGGCTLFAYCYRFYPKRMFYALVVGLIDVIGFCLMAFDPNKYAQLAGYLLYSLLPLISICCLSSIASNVAGHTKKVTVNAVFLVGYCVGNLIGPQTFIESQEPDYVGAKIAMVVSVIAMVVFVVALWVSMEIDNRVKDKSNQGAEEVEEIDNKEFADLTDKENPLFRYTI